MIVIAKLTLFFLWCTAFLVTCLVMGVTFPIIVLFDRYQTVMKEVPIS